MDSSDARTSLDDIHAREEQVIAEAKRWPPPWFIACFAVTAGTMMSVGDLDRRPIFLGAVLGIATAVMVVLMAVFVARFRRSRVMVHHTRYGPRMFWVWLVTTAVMIAIGIGGPPALTALGIPLPFTGSGALLAIAIYVTAVATNRAVRPRVPRSDP